MTSQPSDRAVDLAFLALDHGIGSIDGGRDALIPFAIVESAEGRALNRFMAGTLEDSVAQGRVNLLLTPGLVLAVLAWDGFLTIDGQRSDAIFGEVYERGGEQSFVFAQRYRRTGLLRKRVERVGNVVLAGAGDPLFR
ncbi:MAG: hypothetical protein J7484_15155 [Microbacterium sp.]|nr:hypothetical protein [Microbacterium sp.]